MGNNMHLTGGSIEVQTYVGRAATRETEDYYSSKGRSWDFTPEQIASLSKLVKAVYGHELEVSVNS